MRLSDAIDSLYFKPSEDKKKRNREKKVLREFVVRLLWRKDQPKSKKD